MDGGHEENMTDCIRVPTASQRLSSTGPARISTRSSVQQVFAWYFGKVSVFMALWQALRPHFLQLVCLVQLQLQGFHLILFMLFLMFVFFLLEACTFLKENRRQWFWGKQKGKLVGVYYMREQPHFDLKVLLHMIYQCI